MKTLFTRFVLLGVLLLSTLTASAYDAKIDGIYYNLDKSSKTASVTYESYGIGCGLIYFGDIVIPTTVTYNNVTYSVTSIGLNSFLYCSNLTSITIPNSVTSIGNNAFQGCSSLTSITIPNSVTSIGEDAFYKCYGLTSVTIPNSVTNIGESAFYKCNSLPVIDGCRYADTYLVEAIDKDITVVNIKEGTRFIGGSAFSGCSNLTSVTIPNSVTSIGPQAFYNCIYEA